jgi:hypothetical protein
MFVSPASQVMIYRVCLVAMGLRRLRRGEGYGENGSFAWISSLERWAGFRVGLEAEVGVIADSGRIHVNTGR